MADEMVGEVPTEKPTEDTTTGGRYLTKNYLVRNLQNFWAKIKSYIAIQISVFAKTTEVNEALASKANQTDFEALTTEVGKKAEASEFIALRETVKNKVEIAAFNKALEGKVDTTALDEALAGKVNVVPDKGLSTNDYTTAEKNKLRDIAENANNYSHPTDSGNKHIPIGGNSGQVLRWESNGTAVWGDDNNTIYSEATEDAAGLMSIVDKKKLDSIDEGATAVTVDSVWDPNSKNPAQSKVISAELAKKADIEKLEDPSKLDTNGLIEISTDDNGHLTLTFSEEFKHIKMHSFYKNSYECIEKFAIKQGESVIFNNLLSDESPMRLKINNPDGKDGENWILQNATYVFYVECLELVGGVKYKPFVLQIDKEYDFGVQFINTSYTPVS